MFILFSNVGVDVDVGGVGSGQEDSVFCFNFFCYIQQQHRF